MSDLLWLQQKRAEYRRFKSLYAGTQDISNWDVPRFLAIINDRDREIRKLKVQLAAKR